MLNVFFLASELGLSGAARQLALLAANLPRDRFRVEVGVLGSAETPIAGSLRDAAIPVRSLPMRSGIDVRGMRRLRAAVGEFAPTIIHAWGPRAVRASRITTSRTLDGGNLPRVVVSAASEPLGGVSGWLTARRLRRADRVVPATWAEAERYRRDRVAAERLTRIGPGIAPPPALPDRAAGLRELGLPENTRFIATAARLDPHSGLKAAIWAFDMLRYDHPELHLVIFGEGAEREALIDFGMALAFDDFRIHLAGCRADLPAVLGLAEAVWVTHDWGGVNLALEGMAAGRPVLGWKSADPAEVIDDEQTGFLVPTGERTQLSAKTYALLGDANRASKLGAAGRARAAEHYSVARMVEQYARLYTELAE